MKKINIKKEKGITLVALVITIIVLVILATVSINILFDEGGLINRAQQSSDIDGEQRAKEKLILELNAYTIEVKQKGITKFDEKDALLKKTLEKLGPTAEAEDPKYYEVEVDGWIFWVNRDTLEITTRGKVGKTIPIVKNVLLTTGKNDVKVDVSVVGGKGAKYKYYYKKAGEKTYTLAKETDTSSYTITGLEENARYLIKVEVINENGSASKEAVGRTGIVPSAVGAITFGELVWNNGKAEVAITKTTSDELEIQYRVDEEEYKTIASGEKVTGLELDSIVTVRLWDGQKGGNTASLNVKDAKNPNEAVIVLDKQAANVGENIIAQISQSDNESGVDITKCRWIYNKTNTNVGEDETNYTGVFTSETENISLTATSSGEYYLHVLTVDRAGNKTEKISKKVTIKSLVTKITLSKTSTEIEEGETEKITATIEPADADNKEVEWTSSNEEVATVANGIITAVKAGTATITVTAKDGSNVKAECAVTVKQPGPITITENLKGAFIKYDVEYTDTYHTRYQYTNTNGWRLENYDLSADGKTISNVRLISTGIPAVMRYKYSDTSNNYSNWVTDTTKLAKFKNNVLGSDYVVYTGNNTYYGLQASAGFYYNLGEMTFIQAELSDTTANQGSYIKVKNGNTTYTSGTQIGNNLFKARSDATIRMLTLPELNKALGRTDVDSVTTIKNDTTGIYAIKYISTGTPLSDKKYSSDRYWLASPYPKTGSYYNVSDVHCDGRINVNISTKLGVRPLVCISSKIQLIKKIDDTGFVYYEMVDAN